MSEQLVNRYKRLFEVRLLHHYWLDEGGTIFDLMPVETTRDARLSSYDARSFLAVTPTAATAAAFDACGCVYKNTALGCIAAAPSNAVIPADATFDFVVTIQDSAFFNYTALTLRPQNIYELYHQPEDRSYRYKENVPVLSNVSGASRGTGLNKTLFLSREIPAPSADDKAEALVLSGGALMQLTGDQPGAGTQQLSAVATALPVFVHQGDVPAIVPPTGLLGAPKLGLMLSDDIPDNVFALIRLAALLGDDDSFSLIDAAGQPKVPHRVFHIRFKNRSTVWRYFNKSTGALTFTEPAPLPSTHFGNAGTRRKPSEGLVKAVKSGTAITQLLSDIFA